MDLCCLHTVESWLKEIRSRKKITQVGIHRQVREWIAILKEKSAFEKTFSTQTKQSGKMSAPRLSLKVSFSINISKKGYNEAIPTGRSVRQLEVPKRQLAARTDHFDDIGVGYPDS